jgi:hypothetical protein
MTIVTAWWLAMSLVAVVNIVLALRSGDHPGEPSELRRRQRALSIVYVIVCAFRSLAELAFAAQWALLLGVVVRGRPGGLVALIPRANRRLGPVAGSAHTPWLWRTSSPRTR